MTIAMMNNNTLELSTMKPKNTGRKKILIKKIEETTSRQVTFSKRRTGLFKKASELCVLTGAEMAILVQSPGGHCYAFGQPSVDALIDRYMNYSNDGNDGKDGNDGSASNDASMCSNESLVAEVNRKYGELERELEREKRKYEAIQQEKMGSSSEFPWYEQDVEGMEVEELEQYVTALGELKRKVIVRAGDLANMENASMLSLGPSTWSNNPSNTFDNAPLNMQIFDNGIKNIEHSRINVPTSDVDFGDGIKYVNNPMNGLKSDLGFGDGVKYVNNPMNGLTGDLGFGDGVKYVNNPMNGPTNDLGFGDGIKYENNTLNGLAFGGGSNHMTNAMNGPENAFNFGGGNNHETNNAMNCWANDQMGFDHLGMDMENLF